MKVAALAAWRFISTIGRVFLTKPYDPNELICLLAELEPRVFA